MPNNTSNGLYNYIKNNPTIRGFNNAVVALESELTSPGPFQQATDYEKVENARKLNENAKEGSLASKANMVKKFNESNK